MKSILRFCVFASALVLVGVPEGFAGFTLEVIVEDVTTSTTLFDKTGDLSVLTGAYNADGFKTPGSQTIQFDAGNVSPGSPVPFMTVAIGVTNMSADPFHVHIGLTSVNLLTGASGFPMTGATPDTVTITLITTATGQSVVPGSFGMADFSSSVSGGTSGGASYTFSSTYAPTPGSPVTLSSPILSGPIPSYTAAQGVPDPLFTLSDTIVATFTGANQSAGPTAFSDVVTPEPASVAIWGVGLGLVGGIGSRRRRRAAG